MYTYYRPSYSINKIKASKLTYYTKQNNNTLFESKEEAIKAIEAVYQEAKDRFEVIKQAIVKLQKDLDFELSSEMEGDTHSVELIEYIEFKINGFVFKFRIAL